MRISTLSKTIISMFALLIISFLSVCFISVQAAHADAPSKVTVIERHFFLSDFPDTFDQQIIKEYVSKLKPTRVAQFDIDVQDGVKTTSHEGKSITYIKDYLNDDILSGVVNLSSDLTVTPHFKGDVLVLKNRFKEKVLVGADNGFVKEHHKGRIVQVPYFETIDESFKGKLKKYKPYVHIVIKEGNVISIIEVWHDKY